MEIITKTEHTLPILWKLWATVAIFTLLGAILNINSFLLFADKFNESDPSTKPGIIYFNFLRFIICGLAIYGLYLLRKPLARDTNPSRLSLAIQFGNLKTDEYYFSSTKLKISIFSWRIIFLILAIVFNPLIPIFRNKGIFYIIDIISIALIFSAFFLLRIPVVTLLCDHCGTVLKIGKFYGGYYKNYYEDIGNFFGNELCFWCTKELIESGELEISAKDSLIKDHK